jgi:5-methylcytosine-specific restriction endonuclease McrA
MALEAALLHVRNILDFFTGDSTSYDDIQAAHFLPGFTGWKSDKLELLRERRKDLNSSINHLTYRRTKGRLDWDELKMICDEVHAAFEEFITLLPKDEQPRWLASRP